MSAGELRCGVYRHYKGNRYLLLGVARHTETEECLVTYVALYPAPAGALWARPLKDFLGEVEVGGVKRRRFEWEGVEDSGA